jgi:hypothetical protein
MKSWPTRCGPVIASKTLSTQVGAALMAEGAGAFALSAA